MYILSLFLSLYRKWDSSKNITNHKYYTVMYHFLPEVIITFKIVILFYHSQNSHVI